MSTIGTILWKSIGSCVVALLLCGAVWLVKSNPPSSKKCTALDYHIMDSDERLYLTEDELDSLLRVEDIYPTGRTVRSVSLSRIESAVARHPMVRQAECYMNQRNDVVVELTQRVPLLYVAVPGQAGYFIDTDRKVMPYRPAVKDNLLVVTGTVGKQTASTQLADFAQWLQSDSYWQKRIRRVHMINPRMVGLWLNGANQPRVLLGEMDGYERKLAKLRTFMENSADATAGKEYSVLDVRFRGQVVAR